MSSRQLEEMQEEQADRSLAEYLEISYDDLCELSWDVDTNESNDDMLYEYVYKFSDDSPTEILSKIKSLRDGNYVYVPADAFK